MDLERLTGAPGVDEQAVEAELAEYMGDQPAADREPFTVSSMGRADWVMRRLADVRHLIRQYDDEIYLWAKARERADGMAKWFEARLKEWAIAEREQHPERKTFTLAHGSVSTRSSKPRAVVEDEAVVMAWAREHCPEAIETVPAFERLAKSALTVEVDEVVVGWEAINNETAEVQMVPLPEPYRVLDRVQWEQLNERMAGHTVTPVYQTAVVDDDGVVVPGMAAYAASTTATVTPLGV